MNARDAIAAAIRRTQPFTARGSNSAVIQASDVISALRAIAGADDGATITIGPDGAVGRLEPTLLPVLAVDGQPHRATTYRIVAP